MNIYTAHIMFNLQSKLTGDEFNDLKIKFHKLLEENKPDEAQELINIASALI